MRGQNPNNIVQLDSLYTKLGSNFQKTGASIQHLWSDHFLAGQEQIVPIITKKQILILSVRLCKMYMLTDKKDVVVNLIT